ncbi:hypothetical protein [Flammeovirga sp. SubArs3]|uniref:hypothetical protein n=1 Tax=Flammeovirga sp. SubArs3 TaxID=2995316 RepID=UPI00248AEF1E|nr:hypothetical protein [Flammeovirga sp. SubArs3]
MKPRFILNLLYLFTFNGILQEIGLPIVAIKYASEAITFFSLMVIISKINLDGIDLKILGAFAIYATVVTFSVVYNGSDVIDTVKYSRYTFIGILFFIAARRIDLTEDHSREIFRFLALIAVIQVVASLINSKMLLHPLERKVGTLVSTGGSLATIYVMFISPYFLSYYLFTKQKKYLYLTVSTLFIGIASGKRAVVFFYIVINLITYFRATNKKFSAQTLFFILLILFCGNFVILNVSSGVQSTGFFNIIDNYSQAIEYANTYTNNISPDNYAMGRIGSSKNIFNYSLESDDIMVQLIGFGPKVLMGNMIFHPYKILYGIVGWGNVMICVGFLGLFFYVRLYKKMHSVFNKERSKTSNPDDHFMKALQLGTSTGFIVWFVSFFFYSTTFVIFSVPLFMFMITLGYSVNIKKNHYA